MLGKMVEVIAKCVLHSTWPGSVYRCPLFMFRREPESLMAEPGQPTTIMRKQFKAARKKTEGEGVELPDMQALSNAANLPAGLAAMWLKFWKRGDSWSI